MKQNRKQKWQGLTLKSLEAWLRRLPEVKVPEALKPSLLAAVPDGRASRCLSIGSNGIAEPGISA